MKGGDDSSVIAGIAKGARGRPWFYALCMVGYIRERIKSIIFIAFSTGSVPVAYTISILLRIIIILEVHCL